MSMILYLGKVLNQMNYSYDEFAKKINMRKDDLLKSINCKRMLRSLPKTNS